MMILPQPTDFVITGIIAALILFLVFKNTETGPFTGLRKKEPGKRSLPGKLASALLIPVLLGLLLPAAPVRALSGGDGSEESPWLVDTWSELSDKMTVGGYITLSDSFTSGSGQQTALTVPTGVTVILDLNGKTIDRGVTSAINDGYVIRICESLTLRDSKGGGIITGGKNSNDTSVPCTGGGICIDRDMNSNHIELIMEGGNITGNAGTFGGGVSVAYNGKFTMTGGSITNNEGNYDGGGGVYIYGGSFIMSGGTISGNTASGNGNGGGVYLESGTFNMSGAALITENSAKYGGGVSAGGTFTMTGGSITKNTASISGGGVVAGSSGNFILNGGTIGGLNAGNKAPKGGGIYVVGPFSLSGAPEVSGNTKSDGTTADNVYLNTDITLTVTGRLNNTTPIGISMETPGVFTGGTTTYNDDDNFTSDNAAYSVGNNTDRQLVLGYTVTYNSGGESIYGRLPRDRCTYGDNTQVTVLSASGICRFVTAEGGNGVYYGADGWTISGGDGTVYSVDDADSSNDSFTISGNTTLLPHWSEVPAVASLRHPTGEIGWEDTFYTSLKAALEAAADNGGDTITLLADIDPSTENSTGDESELVLVDKDVTLDLNGHTVSTDSNDVVVKVTGALTLNDTDGGGQILNTGSGNSDKHAAAVFVTTEYSEFTMNGGNVSGGTGAEYSMGVYLFNGGQFTMNGGTVSGSRSGVYHNLLYNHFDPFDYWDFDSSSVITLKGGTISGNTYGVWLSADYLELTGDAEISGNSCGVWIEGGDFDLNGGTISGNKVGVHASQGVEGPTSIWMAGGEIIENIAAAADTENGESGGVVIVSSSANRPEFTMEGGTITGNGTAEGAGLGGGVNVLGGIFELKGGTISGNSGDHGDVYVGPYRYREDSDPYPGGAMELKGPAAVGNVYLAKNLSDELNKITVTGSLTSGGHSAQIGVTLETGTGVFTTGLSGRGSAANFSAGNSAYYVDLRLEDSEAMLSNAAARLTHPTGENTSVTTGYPSVKAALAAAADAGDTVTLLAEINRTTEGSTNEVYLIEIPTGKKITLDLAGQTIDAAPVEGVSTGNMSVIRVYGAELTLNDSSSGGTGTITGGVYTYSGGVCVESAWVGSQKFDSVFTMNGGNITGNSAGNFGGGVYVDDSSFILNGGNISGNSARDTGGGVYVYDSSFILNGGNISGNSVSSTNLDFGGGGVYFSSYTADRTFTMTGGTIGGDDEASANNAHAGAGVYVRGGTFTMSGGKISGSAGYYGGGVYVHADGSFAMTGGEISGNSAESSGGGVFTAGSFTMSGSGTNTSTVSGNSAKIGGGVYVKEDGSFTMGDGAYITGNRASDSSFGGYGGGVSVMGGSSFAMTGGEISGNSVDAGAQSQGGGIMASGSFSISGSAKISGNTKGNGTDGPASNAYLSYGMISITGELTGGEGAVGVTLQNRLGVFTDGLSGNGSDASFSSDDGFTVLMNGDGEAYLGLSVSYYANDGTGTLVEKTDYNDFVEIEIRGADDLTPPAGMLFRGWNTAEDGTGISCDPGDTFYPDSSLVFYAQWGEPVAKVSREGAEDKVFPSLQKAFNDASQPGSVVTILDGKTISSSTDWFPIYVGDPYGEYVRDIILDLNGQTIDLAGNDSERYIIIKSGSTLTLRDSSCIGDDHPGTGTIKNGYYNNIYVSGTFIMEAGTITHDDGITGSGVYVYRSEFTMNGGGISGNSSESTGSGVYVNRGEFTMNGGEISGNSAAENGGGVYVNNSEFTMNGGGISGNSAGDTGGGVYVETGTFTAAGGGIVGNSAGNFGGGVFVAPFYNNPDWGEYTYGAVMNAAGPVRITGNTNDSGAADNVYLADDSENYYPGTARITVTGDPAGDETRAEIGVTMQTGTGVFTNTADTDLAYNVIGCFTSDDPVYGVGKYTDAHENAGQLFLAPAVTVSGIKAENKVYDGKTTAELDFSGVKFTASDGTAVSGLSAAASGSFVDADAGTGKTVNLTVLTLSGENVDNFGLAADSQQTAAADITPAAVTVTANNAQKTFGAKDPALTASVSGLVNGESADLIQYTISRAAGENAGTYTVTPSGNAVQGNYSVTYKTGTFTINKKVITPVITVSGTYTYTGSAITPSFTVKDGNKVLAGSDYTAVISDNINVGNGKITVTAKDGGNYSFSRTVQTFAIGKAAGPAAPAGLKGVAPTSQGGSDGKITGTSNLMECSTDGKTWKACSGSAVTGLKSGTYYVRVKETATHLAGAAAKVTVPDNETPPAAAVQILDSSGTNITGKTVTVHTASSQLKGVVSPAAALQKVTWKSSDTNTATVDSAGKVTFKKTGTVTVTATAADGSKKSASVKLTYVPLATGVIIQDAFGTNITGKTVTVGSAAYQLKAVVSPAAASQKVTWKSSDTGAAAVDSTGKVTFKKSGTVTVTATAADGSKKSASVKLSYSAEPPVLEIKDSNVRGKNKEIQIVVPWPAGLSKVECVLYDDETGKQVSPLPAYKERMDATGKNRIVTFVGSPLENGHVYRFEIRVSNGQWSNKVSKYAMPIANVYGATVVAGNRTMIINNQHREPCDGTRYMIYDPETGKEIAYKAATRTNTTWTYGELQNGKLYYVVAVPYRDYKGQRLWGPNEKKIYFLPMGIPGNGAVSFSGTDAKVSIGRDGSVDGIRVLYRPVGGAIVNGCEGAGNSCTVKGLKNTAAYEFYALKYRTVDGRKYYSTGTLIPWNTGTSGLKAPQMNPTVAMSNSGNTTFTIKKAAEAEGLSVLYREGEGDFLQACEKAGNSCNAMLDVNANYTFYMMQYRTVNGKKLYSPGIVARDYSSGKAGTGSSTAAKSVEALPAEEIAGDPLELYRLEEEQKAPNVPGFKK